MGWADELQSWHGSAKPRHAVTSTSIAPIGGRIPFPATNPEPHTHSRMSQPDINPPW